MHSRISDLPMRPSTKARDATYQEFYRHSSAPRVATDEVIAEALRKQYPNLQLTLVKFCDFLGYAAAGHAKATPVHSEGPVPEEMIYRDYMITGSRKDGVPGVLYDHIVFGKYLYEWKGQDFILYMVVGNQQMITTSTLFLLGPAQSNDLLILEVFRYQYEVHNTVLVFEGGYWQPDAGLWESVQKSNWEDVILDTSMKKSIIGEVNKFFDSEERYKKLKVPWKRGIIFHGPPGNGKTISIKAMMHSLYSCSDPIPTLYVRSLKSYYGPEASIKSIFGKARSQSPCFLVFEDLDSIVTDEVRSYFLNEVDGLLNNDGILMVGSTNHLERLDPGISKRPSRFDRKYLFPDPSMEERVRYCEFWRRKLEDNEDVEFPVKLDRAIASITKGFSFAYIQEAFVTALLAIASSGDEDDNEALDEEEEEPCGTTNRGGKHMCSGCPSGLKWEFPGQCWDESSGCFDWRGTGGCEDDEDLDQYVLWREIKKVVKSLRNELEQGKEGSSAE